MVRFIGALIGTLALCWAASFQVFSPGAISQSEARKLAENAIYCAKIKNREVIDIRIELTANLPIKKGGLIRLVDRYVIVGCDQNGVVTADIGLSRKSYDLDILLDRERLIPRVRDDVNDDVINLLTKKTNDNPTMRDEAGRPVRIADIVEAELVLTFYGKREKTYMSGQK